MCCEYSIEIMNVSKVYKLYDRPSQRFLDIFTNGKLGENREFFALKDFSLKVKKGESIGILGKNGAGKSTLLQILAGIIEPSSGTIKANGTISALLELGAGFNPEYTGRDNIILSASIYGVDLNKNHQKIDEIIKFAEIGEFIDQPVKTYSSGMFVRLAFAVASQMEPDILIVDEALSVGDLQFQTKCLRLIEKLRERGCTFIFVSHSPRMVEVFCDRAIWLENGVVKQDGEPKKVVRAYENMMVGNLDSKGNMPNNEGQQNSLGDHEIDFNDTYHTENRTGFAFRTITLKVGKDINPLFVSNDVEQEFEACVSFEAADIVSKPLFAIGLFNELNQPVVHFNTDNTGVVSDNLEVNAGINYIKFKTKLPRLRPGEYLLAVGLDDGVPGNSEVIAHIYDAYKINVISDAISSQAGYIQLANCNVEKISNV